MHEQGDIVLIPIPFTDLSSQKRRPVIVISNDAYNRETVFGINLVHFQTYHFAHAQPSRVRRDQQRFVFHERGNLEQPGDLCAA